MSPVWRVFKETFIKRAKALKFEIHEGTTYICVKFKLRAVALLLSNHLNRKETKGKGTKGAVETAPNRIGRGWI